MGAAAAFLERAKAYRENDCLIWPFSTTDKGGYGQIRIGKHKFLVHRLVCEAVWGPPPDKSMQACHSIECHTPSCVNGLHLRWDTAVGNTNDKRLNGTATGDRKYSPSGGLYPEEVLEIRRLWRETETTQRELAIRFNVGYKNISRIVNYSTWKNLP